MATAKLGEDGRLGLRQWAKVLLVVVAGLLLLDVTNTLVESAYPNHCLLDGLEGSDLNVGGSQWVVAINETILAAKANADRWWEGGHGGEVRHADVGWGPLDQDTGMVVLVKKVDDLLLAELSLLSAPSGEVNLQLM